MDRDEDILDEPLDNPMYCGRFGGFDAYLAGEEARIIFSDPSGLDLANSPVRLVQEILDADLRRHLRRARLREGKRRKTPRTRPPGPA